MANKVFMVQLDWTTDDDNGNDIYLFKDYDKAKEQFYKFVEQEKDPNLSWAHQAFDETYSEERRYEIETNIDWNQVYELFWDITDTWNYNFRTHIQLREMEVQ